LANEFRHIEGIDLRQDETAWKRLLEAAEKAKIDLSNVTQSEVNLPFISANKSGSKNLNITLTRPKLEELCSDLTNRCRALIETTIDNLSSTIINSRFTKDSIDEVVMVGGSSRMPAVLNLVKQTFGKVPNQTVNPDEVVALGMAILGGTLAGKVKDILLLDVTPMSLGVETSGGVMTKIIPRDTTIPTKKSEVFSTAHDGQTSVDIYVFQGDHETTANNKIIATLNLSGIPPAPRGVPQIEVIFDVDANEILMVTAKDKATGKEQSFSLCDISILSVSEQIANKSRHGGLTSLALRNEKPGFSPPDKIGLF
jgi:molecular chaperone DnaK